MMSVNQFLIINYLFWIAVRMRGAYRRWRQPLVRGPEWFFSVHVPPDFYAGVGKRILNRYRMRMLMTFAVEIPAAAAIVISGHLSGLVWLIVAIGIALHVNHVFNVDRAERTAQVLAVPEGEDPVPAVVFSLKTRRLSDYSNRPLEWAIALATIGSLVWLIRYYYAAPVHQSFVLVFGRVLFLLYCQAGLLLGKKIVLAWRAPLPRIQAEEHLEAREKTRKLYLAACDVSRVICAAAFVFWSFLLPLLPDKLPGAAFRRLSSGYLIALIAIGVAATVWQEIRRKQVLAVAIRARPVKLPNLLGDAGASSPILCYQPAAPMMVLKGPRGYSLNLANGLAQVSAAYLVGLVALFVALGRMSY